MTLQKFSKLLPIYPCKMEISPKPLWRVSRRSKGQPARGRRHLPPDGIHDQGGTPMAQKLKNSVVVITGASSGIGRATAIEFAKKRARLVLAARSEDNLDETAEECKSFHTEVIVVPADVSREDEVQNVAGQAIEKFGRIDVWVNDAGVGFYGRFEEIPSDAFRQVIETNLFGSIYGARAALPQFRKQGRGVLINISSQLAFGGAAYSSAYAISKYGLRALSDTLRQEFEDNSNIHLCTVYPVSTDTPFF